MKIKLRLERLYSAVISSEDKNFYPELKRYINYFQSEKKFNNIIKKLKKAYKIDSLEYNKISSSLIKRFSEIKYILKEKNKGNKRLENLFGEFEGHLSGKITSTAPTVESLFYLLQDIIQIFKENKKENLEDIEKEIISLIKKYYQTKKPFEIKQKVAEWYALLNLEKANILDEEINTSKLNISTLGGILLKKEMEGVIRGDIPLNQEKRREYESYLEKVHKYILEEIGDKRTIKNPLIWIPLLIIIPLFISIFLYNPFVKYDLSNSLIKQISFDKELNRYIFQIDNLNESKIKDELVVNFIESFTRTSFNFKRYDLYFEDNSYIETPKRAILEYNISFEGENIHVKQKESKILKENIKFNKSYEVTLTPQITFISDDSKVTESFDFKPSFGFFIKKSFLEFILKFIIFYVVWITLIIMPLNFIINKLFKKSKT